MKRSRYTVAIEGDSGKHLLYNTANGAFLVADKETYAAFVSGRGGRAEELLEQGLLTLLTDEEELAAQKALFDTQRVNHDELTLVLAPTYSCNFRCPYCYELGHNAIKGKMSAEVMDAIMRFIGERYDEHAFVRLSVQWYGGDPSLALDVVEALSKRMISFCRERGVDYGAMMLTNCNLIDEAAADMLASMQVKSVFITIDGFEETHNERRVSASGTNSFERNIAAARLFVERGIEVRANMNVDRVNWPEYQPLRDQLRDELGVNLGCGRLCDYGGFFGTRDFKPPRFDLFEHEEFCLMTCKDYLANNPTEDDLRALLSPCARFCNGQRDDYFVIDSIGDVYLCDGYIGEKGHVKGSVLDNSTASVLHEVSHDPSESAQCRACEILPICQGNCDWERHKTGMVCHPLKTTLPEYLRYWQRLIENDG